MFLSFFLFFQYLQLVFRPPLELFDVIIHLKLDKLARQHEAVDITAETNCPKYKLTTSKKEMQPMPVYDFDPAQVYYQELQVSLLCGQSQVSSGWPHSTSCEIRCLSLYNIFPVFFTCKNVHILFSKWLPPPVKP